MNKQERQIVEWLRAKANKVRAGVDDGIKSFKRHEDTFWPRDGTVKDRRKLEMLYSRERWAGHLDDVAEDIENGEHRTKKGGA